MFTEKNQIAEPTMKILGGFFANLKSSAYQDRHAGSICSGGFLTRRKLALGSMFVIAAITTATASAQSDHYFPASYNIRDFTLPDPGFYGAVYNIGYLTDDLKNADGNPLNSVTITGPGGRVSATVNVHVDLHLYALAPLVIWVPKKKILGAKYGVMLNPTFSNTSLGAALSRVEGTGQGISASGGQFAIADTYVAPFWMDWTGKHYDAVINYGFYIPTGSYHVQTANVPVVGPVRVVDPDNTGLGFWENQVQSAIYWYPWPDKRMAVENAITWEIDQKKRSFDLTYGDFLTWNWGVSEFLPLKKDESLLAEIGPAGYGNFQVSNDTGSDAPNDPNVHQKVYGAGIQVGLTMPKRMMILNFHWFREFSAVDRFQGTALGLSFVARFGAPK